MNAKVWSLYIERDRKSGMQEQISLKNFAKTDKMSLFLD